MKRLLLVGLAGSLTLGLASQASASVPITASYYNDSMSYNASTAGYTDTGSGINFTGTPYQVDYISSINNYSDPGPDPTYITNSDPNYPNASLYFAANYTSDVSVASAGTYTFSETSDDAGYLFVNGVLVADTPGNHISATDTGSITLAAGTYSLDYQTDNLGGPCCSQSTVVLPADVSYVGGVSAIPEPGTWLLMLAGIGGIGLMLRRAKKLPGLRSRDCFTA